MVKIAVLGSAHLSLLSRVQGFAQGAERPGELSISFGGTGFNLAVNLARLGATVTFGTIMADTSISRMIVADLQRSNVLVKPEFRPGLPEAGYSAHVSQSDDILSAVASTPVSQASFRRDYLETISAAADALVLECNLSLDTLTQVTKIANASNQPVWVGGVSELKTVKVLDMIKAGCRISGLFLNEMELANLLLATGCGEHPSDLARRFGARVLSHSAVSSTQPQDIARQFGGFIVETRGPAGVAVWHGDSVEPVAQYRGPRPNQRMVESTPWLGAGDQLMAMTIYAIHADNADLVEAACKVSQKISENPIEFLRSGDVGNPLEARMSSLRDAALTDPLTKLWNRRGLDDWMSDLAPSRLVAVLMMDIDHFKAINDELGHDGGDAVLRDMGTIILTTLRTSDFGCRWGGEEIVAILLDVGEAAAREVAERLRGSIAAHPFTCNRTVTCSIGVALGTPATFEQTCKRADTALYQAKTGGRNRVVMSEQADAESVAG